MLIGDIVNGRSLNIIGMGQCSSQGLKKGEIIDFKAVSNCTHAALMGAEKSAGAQVECVYLSQTGSHLNGVFNSGAVNVTSADSCVRAIDIERVTQEAKSKELPQGWVYIHHMQNAFLLDGEVVDQPLGMQGEKLEVNYWSVYGAESKVRDHIHVINGFGLNVEDMIISSIASGIMVASDVDKRQGVLVIDIGSGTTDWVLYHGGVIVQTGVLAVGGDHILNDLCIGMRLNRKYAARLLLEFGKANIEKSDRNEKVWMVGDQTIGDRYIAKQGLVEIIHTRVNELFTVVANQLGENCNPEIIPAGAILTGGVAELPHITEVAGAALGLDARLGSNPSWVREDLRAREFSTTLGLLHYALTGDDNDDADAEPRNKSLLGKVTRLFTSS